MLAIIVLNFVCGFQNASAQAALQAAQALSITQNSVTPAPTPTTPVTNGQDIQGGPNTVLRVIIEHMIYPISLDILHLVRVYSSWKNGECARIRQNFNYHLSTVIFTHSSRFQIFQRFGKVLKIVTFTKNSK